MRRLSRRGLLATAALAARGAAQGRTGRGQRTASPRVEFLDGLTEREIHRLTDPAVLHHLPASNHRFIARDNSFLLLAAERDGLRQIHRLDLRRDRLTQLTEGPGVHPYAAHLRRDQRGFFFLQRDELLEADLRGSVRTRHYECAPGWILTGEMDVSRNERYAAVVEMREGDREATARQQFERQPLCRVRVVRLGAPDPERSRIAAEERRWLAKPLMRPSADQVLYRRQGPWQQVRKRYQLVNSDGSGKRSVRPARGRERIGSAYWSPDGSHLRFVHYPDGDRWASSIRRIQPETRAEITEAPCSAYGWLTENADGSAIVGASRRPSGPNIYVLFPRMRREITLAEHLSSLKPYPLAGTGRSDPFAAAPSPAVSADSSWIYFVTDREGMPALYAMPVEDLVEGTASGDSD